MKLCFNTIAYKNLDTPLEEILKDVAENGNYAAVEILQPHFEQNDSDKDWLKDIASLARDQYKLDIPIISGYMGTFSLKMDDMDAQLSMCRSFAPVAEVLGARMLRAFVGDVCEITSKDLDPDYYKHVLRGFKELCKIAAESGLKISCEMHDESVIDTDVSVLKFLEDVAADNIGVTFQMDGIPRYSGISVLELYDRVEPHILHMHLNPYPQVENPDNPSNYRDILVKLDKEETPYYIAIENCRQLQTPLQSMKRGVELVERGRRGEIIEEIKR